MSRRVCPVLNVGDAGRLMEDTTSSWRVIEVAFPAPDGREVRESLLVEPVEGGLLRLVRSPGFVQGFAAGDLVRFDEQSHSITLVERGGNVAVQFFYKDVPDYVLAHISQQVRMVAGGTVDGELDGLRVFTFPVTVGLRSIEDFMNSFADLYQVEWMFANVFDEEGRPLNWWK